MFRHEYWENEPLHLSDLEFRELQVRIDGKD